MSVCERLVLARPGPLSGGHDVYALREMPVNNQQLKVRARIAALTRHHPDDQQTIDLARDFKAERLAEYIERVVDAAPPLTQAQRDNLAILLRGAMQ